MSVERRRYRLEGLAATQIARNIGLNVSMAGVAGGSIDVDVENGIAGLVDEVDASMARMGYSYEGPGTVATSLRITSPDGTDWLVTVSDLGVLSVVSA